MQDRYSGDVGDYGKFGLLRHLFNDSEYHLGINWYLYPDEKHNEDGKFTKYLLDPQYGQCDTELHHKLSKVVSNTRCVRAIEEAGLFDCETSFFSNTVDFYSEAPGQTKANKEKRTFLRTEWQRKAASNLSDCDVLFLDPDNGLEIESCRSLNQKRSGKFAYFEEINKFHNDKEITIIYHHLNRHKNHGTHAEQIRNRSQELKTKIDSAHTIYCLRYKPYSPRAFFVIASSKAVKGIRRSLHDFMGSHWGKYWDNYYEQN